MNRRIAIRDLTLAFCGLASIPAWATNGWNAHSFQLKQSLFKAPEQNILEAIVETIIPESGTKGAKSLGVPAFFTENATGLLRTTGFRKCKEWLGCY